MAALLLCSQLDRFDFVVDLEVERVEVTNERVSCEGLRRWLVVAIARFELRVQLFPSLVEIFALSRFLLHAEHLLLLRLHLQSVLKGVWIDFLEDSL